MRTLILLVAGLAIGYWYGFHDAQTHTEPLQRRVAERMVQRAGGASRDRVRGDIDARMERADH